MAVVFDAASNAGGDGVSSVTWSHTCTGTGTDGILRVGVGFGDSSLSSITYNGATLTAIGSVGATPSISAMRRLLTPATGAHNVVVTFAGSTSNIVCGAASYTGVDQTTPTSGLVTGTGSGTGPSLNVTSATDDMAVDTCYNNASSTGWTGGQTEEWDRNDSGGFAHGGGQRAAGAASVTMAWTTAFGTYAHVAVNIKAGGGGGGGAPQRMSSLTLLGAGM